MHPFIETQKEWLRKELPAFRAGDTLRVSVRVREGDKERLQAFEGVCIISAGSEWKGVKLLFPSVKIEHYPYGECFEARLDSWLVKFFHTGWGKTASAGALQCILDHHQPDLTVNLGTCGGFGSTKRGDVILVERTFMYDIVELMDSADVMGYYASSLDLGWLAEPEPYPTRRGLLASADSDLPPERIPFLKSKGALAADWESAALAWVANKNHARLLILRMVSDVVSEKGFSDAMQQI